MGVRKEDAALKRQLDEIVVRRRDDFRALLQRFGVPLVENGKDALTAAQG